MRELRDDAWAIFQAGLKAVDPVEAVKRHVQVIAEALRVGEQRYDLPQLQRIFIIGMGKAGASMALAIEGLLGDRITEGIVNVKYGHVAPLSRITINEAGHPVPDEVGLRGTQQIIQLLEQTTETDLVICLISGGGSALLPSPAEGLSLEDKQRMTKLLLECGATIHEINAIRKHISQVKGGRLARLAYPSTLISLVLSDVIGDKLDAIASGPTVPDSTTFEDCLRVLDKYQLRTRTPKGVLDILERGAQGLIPDTPKAHDPAFQQTQNLIIGSNLLALHAAKKKAEQLGYQTLVLSSSIEGETREVAKVHAAIAKEILNSGLPIGQPACVISGGETTVTIKGTGLGGRNQEFVLSAAIEIAGLDGVVVLSAGTDGTDGPTEAAGAIADGATVQRARELGMDPPSYLQNNDSYHFFQPLGDLLITGPTNTNVMDLRLVLVA
jgi:hydroxypyruvate reductase